MIRRDVITCFIKYISRYVQLWAIDSWTVETRHFLYRRICFPTSITPNVLVVFWCNWWHISLQWRQNDQDSVSNHQPHGCLLNRLYRRRSKETLKLRVTGLCVGNSPGPVNSPHKGPVTRKMFPFDDVIMMTSPPITLRTKPDDLSCWVANAVPLHSVNQVVLYFGYAFEILNSNFVQSRPPITYIRVSWCFAILYRARQYHCHAL